MTALILLKELINLLKNEFKGYTLTSDGTAPATVKVFAQYIPQPKGAVIGEAGLKHYGNDDFESNFPCIVAKLGETTDTEEGSRYHSTVNVDLIFGIYDRQPECQGYADILNMQDKVRASLLENRVLAQKFLLMMPMKSRLEDVETWPVYFGEMNLIYQIGRPQRSSEYVYRYNDRPLRQVN